MYDFTVKTMGIDEIRVRYRQQRRALIREVIQRELVGKLLSDFISSHIPKEIKSSDHAAFLQDIMEDLHEMDATRLFGLGVTHEEMEHWLLLNRSAQASDQQFQ